MQSNAWQQVRGENYFVDADVKDMPEWRLHVTHIMLLASIQMLHWPKIEEEAEGVARDKRGDSKDSFGVDVQNKCQVNGLWWRDVWKRPAAMRICPVNLWGGASAWPRMRLGTTHYVKWTINSDNLF